MQNKVEIQILILAGNNPSVSHTAATSPYTGEARVCAIPKLCR